MNEAEFIVFEKLFREAAKKCFGHELAEPLSETESKLFYNKIFDDTGLVIGWKSLKNYSIYIFDKTKPENPSVSTLDTLARYAVNAPYTDETARKEKESHYPYWFEYKSKALTEEITGEAKPALTVSLKKPIIATLLFLSIAAAFFFFKRGKQLDEYRTDFNNPVKAGKDGWYINHVTPEYWNKSAANSGFLTLYTLRGDNWPDTIQQAVSISNLVYRKIDGECFNAEIQLKDFVPAARWQQAGILLMEDTSLLSKTIRLSIGYNDFFGGYKRSPELIIQAITSSVKESGKPEEIIHHLLFETDSLLKNPSLLQNFNYTSLRIEKNNNQYRFLYGGGATINGAYREISTNTIDIHPKYIGLFALKGFIDDSLVTPAKFKSFSITEKSCE
jgi:hypothetical protein